MVRQLVILLALLLATGVAARGQTVVNTESGPVQSVTSSAGCEVFRGIPYAAPPVGELRWRAPQPAAPWDTVRLCSDWGPMCYPMMWARRGNFYAMEYRDTTAHVRVSEDCLYLNIWIPKGERRRLPVMVWIHGGAFWSGRASAREFWGDSLVAHGVILVTVGYRLATAGFMAHPDLAREAGTPGSGNYGLMDQIAALRWVRRNIAAFGGDSANVTLFGESAGAGSVQALVSSPLCKGLVDKAIMQSGGGYRNIIFPVGRRWSQNFGKSLMKYARCPSIDSLRRVPIMTLNSLVLKLSRRHLKIPFVWPTIDGHVITESFGEATRRSHVLPIPYMIGYNRNDLVQPVMRRAARKWALMENAAGNPTWVYCFDRGLPGDKMKKPGNSGARHTAEIRYVFGTLASSWRPWRKGDWQLSQLMIRYWTNFAKTGNPNGDGLPQWRPYTHDDKCEKHFDITEK